MNPFPIYVIHYSRAPERKRFIQGELDTNHLSATFIEDNDREDLTDDIIREYYDPSPSKWREMIAVSRKVLVENGQFNMSKRSWSQGVKRKHRKQKYAPFLEFSELNTTQISTTIKHLTACGRMIDAHQAFALVLEDDATFNERFAADAIEVLSHVPVGWDFIGIGEGCGLRVPEWHSGETIYRMRPPRTNGAEAHFISERLARAMLVHGKPFTWPIDWLMQYVMMQEDHACYWRNPPIVGQGSEAGLFPSITREAHVVAIDKNPTVKLGKYAFAQRLANTLARARRLVQRH